MSGPEKSRSGPPVKRVGLFGNPVKPELPPAMETIANICRKGDAQVVASSDLDPILPPDLYSLPNDQLVDAVDTVIAMGGDGTMLRAARVLGLSGVPLLGVNMGSLGYLTDVPLSELGQAVENLLAGNYHLENRSRVYVSVWRGGQRVAGANAFNDLVVNMGPLPRALHMELILNGDSLGTFLGDGIIVSTPNRQHRLQPFRRGAYLPLGRALPAGLAHLSSQPGHAAAHHQ